MQVIIDIPEEMHKSIEQGSFGAKYTIYDLVGCIMNGTPLPACHGDLIDKQDFIDVINRDIELYTEWNETGNACGLDIAVDRAECMDVIVKADGGAE